MSKTEHMQQARHNHFSRDSRQLATWCSRASVHVAWRSWHLTILEAANLETLNLAADLGRCWTCSLQLEEATTKLPARRPVTGPKNINKAQPRVTGCSLHVSQHNAH